MLGVLGDLESRLELQKASGGILTSSFYKWACSQAVGMLDGAIAIPQTTSADKSSRPPVPKEHPAPSVPLQSASQAALRAAPEPPKATAQTAAEPPVQIAIEAAPAPAMQIEALRRPARECPQQPISGSPGTPELPRLPSLPELPEIPVVSGVSQLSEPPQPPVALEVAPPAEPVRPPAEPVLSPASHNAPNLDDLLLSYLSEEDEPGD